jgi:regulator of nucleoside diphosphate kinase
MNPSPLYLTRDDHSRLRLLVGAALRSGPSIALEKLRGELERATVIDPAALPAGVVTMGARVKFEDLYSGEIEEYTLSYPEHSDISAGRLSILTPIGTALIGYRTGDIVEWPTPGGIRRLRIHEVTPGSGAPAALPSFMPPSLAPARG